MEEVAKIQASKQELEDKLSGRYTEKF